MIIYPSESFALRQELSEKKLNTYFELTANSVPSAKDSIFAEDGVKAYVDEKNNTESYVYTVLPLVDYICFEVFNAGSNGTEIKELICQWRDYVQAARSHTSLYADVCRWKSVELTLSDEQKKVREKIQALVLTDELGELDDIVRVSCGLDLNKAEKSISSLELANCIASNYVDITKSRAALDIFNKIEVEAALLQEKNDKLACDLSAAQNAIAKKNTQLQHAKQDNEAKVLEYQSTVHALERKLEKANELVLSLNGEIDALNKSSLKSSLELKAVGDENFSLIKRLQEEGEVNDNLAEALRSAEQQAARLKQENELSQLQIAQVQEELEAVFKAKETSKKAFEEKQKEAELKLTEEAESSVKLIERLQQDIELIRQESIELAVTEKEQKLTEEAKSSVELIERLQQEVELIRKEKIELSVTKKEQFNTVVSENELMQLQILQLQEELEFYIEKATSAQQSIIVPSVVVEEEIVSDDVSNSLTEKNITLSLIERLMSSSVRGVN